MGLKIFCGSEWISTPGIRSSRKARLFTTFFTFALRLMPHRHQAEDDLSGYQISNQTGEVIEVMSLTLLEFPCKV